MFGYIIPAFKPNNSDIVVYSIVGETEVALPTHVFNFVIAVSESGDGVLVMGAFVVRRLQRIEKKMEMSLKMRLQRIGYQNHSKGYRDSV